MGRNSSCVLRGKEGDRVYKDKSEASRRIAQAALIGAGGQTSSVSANGYCSVTSFFLTEFSDADPALRAVSGCSHFKSVKS